MAYLITFSCYGTHLRGEPGTWDRLRRPSGRGGPCAEMPALVEYAKGIMRQPAYRLDHRSAAIVLESIRDSCTRRNWHLYAAHVRMTHVHAVIGRLTSASDALRVLKSYATKALVSADGVQGRLRWARHGNAYRLHSDEALAAAIHYVVASQGPSIALYDEAFQSTAFTSPTMNR